jgi:hypothetical protein
MKEFYNFSFCLLLFCFLLPATLFAQSLGMTPEANPKVVRWQPATFSVTLYNSAVMEINNLTLVAAPSAGFSIDISSIDNISIPPEGFVTLTFTLIPDCSAPQVGGIINYKLKAGDVVLINGESFAISIDEPELMFTRADDFVVNYFDPAKTYTRIWAIMQSSPVASVTDVRVINNCDRSAMVITKIELVSDILGSSVIDGTLTGVLDASHPNAYYYNFGASVFSQIGNGDNLFDKDEVIYIRETYKFLSCGEAASVYTFGHGDGTHFCFRENAYVSNISIAKPAYNPDISTVSITFPNSRTTTGKLCLKLSNNSTDLESIMYDNKVRVYMSDLMRFIFTRAYLTDAAGNRLDGFSDLIMTNNTAISPLATGAIAAPAHEKAWVVSFENLNNAGRAAEYETLGLANIF